MPTLQSKTPPRPRRDKTCARKECFNPLPIRAIEDKDPFCSAECAKLFFIGTLEHGNYSGL